MVLLGIVMAFMGFVIAISGLGFAAGVGGRMAWALIGLAVSLSGIIGVINRAYLKNAIWKR